MGIIRGRYYICGDKDFWLEVVLILNEVIKMFIDVVFEYNSVIFELLVV